MIRVNTPDINGTIEHSQDGQHIIFSGRVAGSVYDNNMTFAAASPPDRHASFSGSGLPFTCASQAFDHTKNIGTVKVGPLGDFIVKCQMPNAYYIGLGTTYVQPTLYFSWKDGHGNMKNRSVAVAPGIAYRKLTYPWQRTNASFYDGMWDLPVRTQEQILRDSAYNASHESSPNFWGLKPPV